MNAISIQQMESKNNQQYLLKCFIDCQECIQKIVSQIESQKIQKHFSNQVEQHLEILFEEYICIFIKRLRNYEQNDIDLQDSFSVSLIPEIQIAKKLNNLLEHIRGILKEMQDSSYFYNFGENAKFAANIDDIGKDFSEIIVILNQFNDAKYFQTDASRNSNIICLFVPLQVLQAIDKECKQSTILIKQHESIAKKGDDQCKQTSQMKSYILSNELAFSLWVNHFGIVIDSVRIDSFMDGIKQFFQNIEPFHGKLSQESCQAIEQLVDQSSDACITQQIANDFFNVIWCNPKERQLIFGIKYNDEEPTIKHKPSSTQKRIKKVILKVVQINEVASTFKKNQNLIFENHAVIRFGRENNNKQSTQSTANPKSKNEKIDVLFHYNDNSCDSCQFQIALKNDNKYYLTCLAAGKLHTCFKVNQNVYELKERSLILLGNKRRFVITKIQKGHIIPQTSTSNVPLSTNFASEQYTPQMINEQQVQVQSQMQPNDRLSFKFNNKLVSGYKLHSQEEPADRTIDMKKQRQKSTKMSLLDFSKPILKLSFNQNSNSNEKSNASALMDETLFGQNLESITEIIQTIQQTENLIELADLLTGQLTQFIVKCREKTMFSIGSHQQSDLVLKSEQNDISEHQCQILYDELNAFWGIGEELIPEQRNQSLNGTYLSLKNMEQIENDQPSNSYLLSTNMIIAIQQTQFLVVNCS